MMLDLTAPIAKYGITRDITHIDLYYPGAVAPLSSLITDCVLIDLTGGTEDLNLETLPELHVVEKGNSVILRTGWERYRGTPRYGASPSVDRRLLTRLVEIGVSLILIDSPGVFGGKGGPEHNEVDKYLADNFAYAVENLVNIAEIRETKFRLYCFPIHMTAQNNAPCRVVADPGPSVIS